MNDTTYGLSLVITVVKDFVELSVTKFSRPLKTFLHHCLSKRLVILLPFTHQKCVYKRTWQLTINLIKNRLQKKTLGN